MTRYDDDPHWLTGRRRVSPYSKPRKFEETMQGAGQTAPRALNQPTIALLSDFNEIEGRLSRINERLEGAGVHINGSGPKEVAGGQAQPAAGSINAQLANRLGTLRMYCSHLESGIERIEEGLGLNQPPGRG